MGLVGDSASFFRRFLRNPKRVGAILPSSRYLAEAMVERLAIGPGDVVLEYGPGTGPMTAAIAAALPEGACYLGIERDHGFREMLAGRFPHLAFHQGSVEDVEKILADRQLGKAKAIVSGLPFASLPTKVQESVVQGTRRVLAEDGEFRTFQYVHAYQLPAARRFREHMESLFSNFKRSRPVLRNVPPAYVLSYRV